MTDNRREDGAFQRSVYRKTLMDIQVLERKLPENTLELLAREVLHRLTEQGQTRVAPDIAIQDEEIENLSHLLISGDVNAGARYISELRDQGASLDAIYLTYLGGAAHKLGEWWENDEVSLFQVTIGTGRIYGIMRGLNPLFVSSIRNVKKRAVFASVPGETHTLGIRMASDLFRKSGWEIDLKIGKTHDELISEIGDSACVLIGLSAAGEHAIAPLAKLIVALRVARPECLILVSGNIAAVSSDVVRLMAPDGMAVDFDGAEAELEALWERLSGLSN